MGTTEEQGLVAERIEEQLGGSCGLCSLPVAGAAFCVQVAAGTREKDQGIKGPGHPVPHPGCPGQTQGPALWARPRSSERSERGQGKFWVPPGTGQARNSMPGRC